jgi:Flp pilus assembly protein TadG
MMLHVFYIYEYLFIYLFIYLLLLLFFLFDAQVLDAGKQNLSDIASESVSEIATGMNGIATDMSGIARSAS